MLIGTLSPTAQWGLVLVSTPFFRLVPGNRKVHEPVDGIPLTIMRSSVKADGPLTLLHRKPPKYSSVARPVSRSGTAKPLITRGFNDFREL